MHPPFSSLIKHLCTFVWSMSHFRTSMQGKMGVLLATMCKYDRHMLGNTWSSRNLMSESLCGIYYVYFARIILLNGFPHYGCTTLDLVLASVSPKAECWMKYFFVVILMTGSTLGAYSNCLTVPGEEHSPISSSFIFGALDELLAFGFLGDIVPST